MIVRRPGPLLQMTMALVTLTVSVVLLAELLLDFAPDPAAQRKAARHAVSESLAVQAAALLQADAGALLEDTLRQLVRRNGELRSAGVRRADGELLAQAGGHAQAWQPLADGRSLPDRVSVPLLADGQRWGAVELVFKADERAWFQRWWDQPLLRLVLFLVLAGSLAYAMYMRRALQHLDPASVIPDRVQRAFDVMAEGVLVLDARSRVLLSNRAFHALHPQAAQVRMGQDIAAMPWLAAALPADVQQHPWARAMAEGRNTSGDAMRLGADIGKPRELLVNCAPITDAGGRVRGCLATFDDVTELHRANAALQRAMQELSATQEEIERKNQELQRLASRDALTGVLNRRAFMDAAAVLFEAASRERRPLGLLLLDIDRFKSINDAHGHAVGDRVIQEVARKLHQAVRGTDPVCRYGGEEFCAAVPGLDEAAVEALAERVRAHIEAECGPAVREVPGLRVTVSVGIAVYRGGGGNIAGVIDRADRALYRAKREGRNRVAAWQAEEAQA